MLAVICMRELLAVGGEAHPAFRGQLFGRCIRHALLVDAPSGTILAIVIPVVEAAFGALLVTLARGPPASGPHHRRTRLRAIASSPATTAAQYEGRATPRAISLDASEEHPDQLRKVGCRASLIDSARTSAAHFDEML
jgi:hypothetical protein